MRQSQEKFSCRVVDATRAAARVPQTMIQLLVCLGTHGALILENAKNSELKEKKLLCVPLEAVKLKAVQPALEAARLKEPVCLLTQEARAAAVGPHPLLRGAGPISSNVKEGHGPTLAVDRQPTPTGPASTLAGRCAH